MSKTMQMLETYLSDSYKEGDIVDWHAIGYLIDCLSSYENDPKVHNEWIKKYDAWIISRGGFSGIYGEVETREEQ